MVDGFFLIASGFNKPLTKRQLQDGDQKMKVIGAGLGRTGTMSLKIALERMLDAPSYHMIEVFQHPEHIPVWRDASLGKQVDWEALLGGFESGVDWPICSFAVELSELYPDALILLSTREFESWWKSASNTIFVGIEKAEDERREMIQAMLTNTFTFDLKNKEACREAFESHYDKMRTQISTHRILEWQAGDGWEPICERLGIPIPDEPFPHTNTTEEFQSRLQSAQE
jgi:hypothetical protein